MKRKIIGLTILIVSIFSFLPNAYAGSLSISASSTSVTTNGSVTITVKASGLAGKFSVTSSNGNVLSGGTSSVWLDDENATYKFTAKNTGTTTITVTPTNAADFATGNAYTASKSVTVKVVKPREKSTNNNLKSLSVEGYSISPSFNKNTLEYTVSLESNVEKIKINASKEDGYASLNGTGEKSVVEGDNKFEIVVTSETGSKKTYILTATVKDNNPITKTIDNKDYTVVKRNSVLTKPENFEETSVTINETEIPAFYNEITNLTLIGLKDTTGNIYLYKYDAKTDSYSKFESLTSKSQTIIFDSIDEEKEGFTKTAVTILDKEYTAYQNNTNKDYLLVYGIDLETGNKNWYLYNIKEQSIQTYMSDIIDNMNKDFDDTLSQYKIVLLGMAGLSLVLLIIVIIQISSKNRLKRKLLKKIQPKEEIKEEPKKIEETKEKEPKQINKKKK